jgi:hypothetical protein
MLRHSENLNSVLVHAGSLLENVAGADAAHRSLIVRHRASGKRFSFGKRPAAPAPAVPSPADRRQPGDSMPAGPVPYRGGTTGGGPAGAGASRPSRAGQPQQRPTSMRLTTRERCQATLPAAVWARLVISRAVSL